MTQTNANKDVLQFLQELDSGVPLADEATAPSGGDAGLPAPDAANSQDVLSFLNELDSPGLPPPAANIVQPPGTSQLNAATQPATVLNASNVGPSQQQSYVANPPPKVSHDAPVASIPQPRVEESTSAATGDSWGWGSIWSQAAKVGATATTSLSKGLESAKAMAEETAKAVSENEKVKGIINKEQLGKLGTDISRLTHSLVDTIAPPLSPGVTTPLLASVVTVYFSAPADTDIGDLRDFILATVREMWIGRVCDRVALEGVEAGKEVAGVSEAVAKTKETMEHLQQLASTAQAPPETPTHVNVFLIIQPLAPQLPSPQTQYYITIAAANAAHASASALSQSVATSGGADAPSIGSLAARWMKHQKRRVVETAVADVCEELGVRCMTNSGAEASPTTPDAASLVNL
ncbi:hypothetical protein BDZ88DRAFT_415674 [Geranomyces variabilis]|nr:hypothetical protein BDZ88DRAFT_415674 [Geranomyces variabilis]KAJ3141276.1 hypothetical protein HDU90_007303 [Geranomyces variabilis]